MSRPDFVTAEDIARWDHVMETDPAMPIAILNQPLIREVLYAGLWLIEALRKLECSDENILRLQFTAGQLSFGKDPWQVHQEMLDDYVNNRIEFETDYDA
jgi:hypothetical protein